MLRLGGELVRTLNFVGTSAILVDDYVEELHKNAYV